MGVSVGVLDHFNIRTRNLADTVRFYEDILGLEKGARPNFAFPGAWMYSEGKAVVHLVDISKTDEPQWRDGRTELRGRQGARDSGARRAPGRRRSEVAFSAATL